LDSRSATKPSFATPATVIRTPTSRDSIAASPIATAGSPPEPAIGMMTAAIIGPSDESGPSTRMRDGPNTA
jgi:hypothetical protein